MKEIYRKIKKFIQRGQRGWSDEDTWSFDYYLAEVISGGCKYLTDNSHSYPDGLTEKKWKRILNKISEISEVNRVENTLFNLPNEEFIDEVKSAHKKQKEALELFIKHFNDLWD